MFFRTLGLVALSATLTACNISGSAQKGPFKSGSAITASKLNAKAVPITSSTIQTQIFDAQGRFSIDRIQWNGWTELTATGQFFNELTNADSDNSITLNAITKKDRRFDTANINLFTHMAAARIRQRISQGQNRNNAWRDTQTELKELFGLTRVSRNFSRGVEQLDVLRGSGSFRKDNANLLLFTGAFLSTGGDTDNLESLTSDFADDAEFNGVAADSFNAIASKASEAGLLENLSNNLKSNGASNPPDNGDLEQLPIWVNTDVVVDTIAPVITVTGQANVTLVVGTSYVDEGATATDDVDGEVAATAVDGSDIIDTSVPSIHTITYSASDIAGNTSTATRTVEVVEGADDIAPEIVLRGDNPHHLEVDTSEEPSAYEDLGYTATDNRDEVVDVTIDGLDLIYTNLVGGPYTVTYSATDAAGNSTSVERVVNIVDTTPPVITLEGDNPHRILVDNNAAYEDQGATVTDNYDTELSFSVDLSELDTTTVGTYSITYTAQDSSSNQAVSVIREVIVSDTPNQAPSVDAGSDVSTIVNTSVTLSGSASDDDGSIAGYVWKDENGTELATTASFDFTPATVGEHILTLTVTDDDGETASDQVTITAALPNLSQIVFVSESIAVSRNTRINALNQLLLANVSIVDGSGNTISDEPTFDASSVKLNVPGTYPLEFSYTDSYGRTLSSSANVVVENQAPVASAISKTVLEDSNNNVITLAATDADNDNLVYETTTPANGVLSGTAPNLTYRPNINFFGTDSFDYTASDGVASSTATVTVTVENVNDAPTAVPQSITVAEDSEATTITLNGSDIDSGELTYANTAPGNGSLSGTAPNLTYSPNANYFGIDSFDFSVNDGEVTSTSTVTVTVTAVNDAPTADTQSVTVAANSGATSITLSGSDIDSDELTYSNTAPEKGSLSGTAPNLMYSPNANYSGSDRFEFTVTDGIASSTAIVTITVTAVPIVPQTISFNFNTPLLIEVGAYPNADALYSYIQSQIVILDNQGNTYVDAGEVVSYSIEGYIGEDTLDPNVIGVGLIHVAYLNETQDIELFEDFRIEIVESSQVIPVLPQAEIENYLTIINAARSQARTCGIHGDFPAVEAVTWSDELYKAAYEHSQDMAKSGVFSHTGSGTASDWTGNANGSPSSLVDRVNTYDYNWISISENIAAGTNLDTAQKAVDAWLLSEGHCKNIMSSNITEVGMALDSNQGSEYTHYWTQNFGKQPGFFSFTSTVNLRITMPTGEVISGVEVEATSEAGGASVPSNSQGIASLSLTPAQEFVIKLDKDGYATQVTTVKAPAVGEEINLDITMTSRGETQAFVAENGGVITGSDGASVDIKPSDFIDAGGNEVTGDIEVTITPVDVSNPASLAVFPGEFTGIQETGGETPIISYGTVEYKFTQNGQELQLKPGADATILIPIYSTTYQDGSPILADENSPQKIPLWSLNEETGIWEQEGEGIVVESESSPTGLALQAVVSHFTWWNCDVTMNAANVIVTVNAPETGTAVVKARTNADIGGWRSNTVDTVIAVGSSTDPLPIPSNGEVCFWAEIIFSSGNNVSTAESCVEAQPNSTVEVSLVISGGTLSLGAFPSANISTFIDVAAAQVKIQPLTSESNITYGLLSGDFPTGVTLVPISATSAVISGVPEEAGVFTAVIQGTDAEGNTETLTLTYTVIDGVAPPDFVADPSMAPIPGDAGASYVFDYGESGGVQFASFIQESGEFNLDLKLANQGGSVSQWEMEINFSNIQLTGEYYQNPESFPDQNARIEKISDSVSLSDDGELLFINTQEIREEYGVNAIDVEITATNESGSSQIIINMIYSSDFLIH